MYDLGHFFYTIFCHHILQCENVIISQNSMTLIISFFCGSNNIFGDCISYKSNNIFKKKNQNFYVKNLKPLSMYLF